MTANESTHNDKLAREIAIQAELLALNCALEERCGTGETSEALLALRHDLRQANGRQRSPLPHGRCSVTY
jgi:hypothetical protein